MAIKIHDWNAEKAITLQPGEDFALILSHSAWYIYKALKEAKTKQTV